jgi:YidC/Oxa1 family membrane protein insertase
VNEMSDQVRGIIFVLLVLAVLFVWSHFYSPPVPPSQKQNSTVSQAIPGQRATSSTSGSATSIAAGAPKQSASIPVAQASAEKSVVVDSSLYDVQLSNRGGVVRSWKLKRYFDDQKPPRPLDLVDQDAAQQFGWPFSLVLTDPQLEAKANSALYELMPEGDELNAPSHIKFHWSDGHLDVTKELNFNQDYELSVNVLVTLDGKPIPAAVAWRGGFGDRAVYKASQLVTVFYKLNDKLTLLQYKKLGVSGNQSQPAEQGGPLQFAGVEDQFFTATFIPDGSDLVLWDWTQNHNVSGSTEPVVEMAVGSAVPGPVQMRAFVGPKDLAILERQKPSLEELVQFGWTGIIAKPMLFVLQWLHRYVPNYGWAIVVFTLVLAMALFPIRVWTFHSTRKMQMVAPEIKSIQDRYKKYSMSDPRKRKMNEEVMAVYQREGVNPVGSCIPMLVQLPILWGFYRMLGGAIELRHAPWFGWIHDLSAKDPYYILPVLMAVTTFLMTKMTPTPATVDPAQQKMMSLMPLMFIVIFINLSSGLNLYYFTSNLVGVGQQWFLNRSQPLPSRSKFKKKNE